MNDAALSPESPQWSMKTLAEVNPFPAYDKLREARGAVVWDPGMKSWLAISYDVCKTIESDESTYHIVPADLPDWMLDVKGTRNSISSVVGEKHVRLRRLYMRIFANSKMPFYREKFVLPIIEYNIEKFASKGEAELVKDLSEVIPIRVILSCCGLPWQDDEFISRLQTAGAQLIAWSFAGHPNDERLVSEARAASAELSQMVGPYVLADKDAQGETLISQFRSLAEEEYGEITSDDLLANTKDIIMAAGHTTMHALTNSLYLYLSNAKIRAAVKADQEKSLNALVEEALRTLGSPQWRFRKASRDVIIGGANIKKGDLICCLHAAANRDPEHYGCPHEVDLDRNRVNDHLAFNVGPRMCAGMPLARLEIRECLKVLINRFPNLRLDPSKEPPRFRGYTHRSYAPLHVLF